MPRTARIRWTNSQVARLEKAVRSFNSALGWSKRKKPSSTTYLPYSASFKELKSSIQSARELNNVVNSLLRGGSADSFTLTQNKAGVITTKWKQREAQIAFNVQEQKKARERRKAGIQTDAGILTGNMGRISEYNLAPAKIKPAEMTLEQMERLINRYREQSRINDYDRAASMYDNYLRAMDSVGFISYFPKSSGRVIEIISELAENDPAFLKWAYDTYDERLRIEWVYDENATRALRMTTIKEAWEEIYDDWLAKRTI